MGILLTFLILLTTSCQQESVFREKVASQQENNQFLEVLKQKLPKLEPINYAKILGKTPTQDELELGRMLFNDTILSRNNDVSCATCHLSNHGFADGNSLTVGAGGHGGPNGNNVGKEFGKGVLSNERSLGSFNYGHDAHHFMFRNSLSTINIAYRVNKVKNTGLFWDGRFGDLLFQVILPIHTPEEMCGTNPIVKDKNGKNPFAAGSTLFPKPITIFHTNTYDEFSGRNTGNFNSQPITIKGIPYRRKNNQVSVPNRNECLALAISKVSISESYQALFKKAYGDLGITDKTLAMALQAFLFTHVANRSPYDNFLEGKRSLSRRELLGMAQFLTPANKVIEIGDVKVKGAGCITCHDSGTFGGAKFANLGVRSDIRSPLARGKNSLPENSGFFERARNQRGLTPQCHIDNISVSQSGYAPDIGHASVSLKKSDCFKMRVPPLRNVIETFPYFHHGSENLRGSNEEDPIKRSMLSLKKVVKHHLRGIVNIKRHNKVYPLNPYYDPLEQIDYWIPYYSMSEDNQDRLLKVDYSNEQIENLVHFMAFALWDKDAVKKGALDNDVSHPSNVPSGLSPSISRDQGTQLDYP